MSSIPSDAKTVLAKKSDLDPAKPTRFKALAAHRILLSRACVIGLVLLICISQSEWVSFGSLAYESLFMVGLVLASVAMCGRLWCSLFIAGNKNVSLVVDGPYAMCRNPLYLFSLIGAVGIALSSGILLLTGLTLLAFAVYYPSVIQQEEAYLRQKHGDRFATYCENVPRFWPKLTKLELPAQCSCQPKVFFNHLGSAVWFPIACGLMHGLGLVHSQFKLLMVFQWPF